MRYKLKARVDGKLILKDPVSIEHDGILFDFHVGTFGELVSVDVSLKVPADRTENLASSVGPGEGGSMATFTIGGDPELYNQLVSELQSLESHLAFLSNGGLKRITWENPEGEEFIAETDEERSLVAVSGVSWKREYPEPTAVITQASLRELVGMMHHLDPLRILEAFWREGMNFFSTFQYVLAFYYFYFILEDTYADGKSGTASVLKAYRSSKEFRRIASEGFNAVVKEERHRANLETLFLEEGCPVTSEGLHELLIKVRGRLHHYFSRGSKTRGTPFTQSSFESIALLTMFMATRVIGLRHVSISKSLRDTFRNDPTGND